MPALIPSPVRGRVVWLGVVRSREAALASEARDGLVLRFSGPEGEDHGGETRPSCSRVATLYARGTPIRNARQLSIVSVEELREAAALMGLDALRPEWLGATMVVEGIDDLTHLPPSTRLQFDGGATVTVDMENTSCHLPAAVIEAARPGYGRGFKASAAGRRGVTAWVEREGSVAVGSAIRLFVPAQRAWRGGPSAEGQPRAGGEEDARQEGRVDDQAGGGHGNAPVGDGRIGADG